MENFKNNDAKQNYRKQIILESKYGRIARCNSIHNIKQNKAKSFQEPCLIF